MNKSLKRSQQRVATTAVKIIQKKSTEKGLAKLTQAEINREIQAVRKKRTK